MALNYNHYLAELGIKSTDFPFYSSSDYKYEVDEEGFRASDFFSLDYSLACYIYSHLCYFRDCCMVGHPGDLTMEEWTKIINQMIKGFKLYITENNIRITKTKRKKIQRSFYLFAQWFSHLWY